MEFLEIILADNEIFKYVTPPKTSALEILHGLKEGVPIINARDAANSLGVMIANGAAWSLFDMDHNLVGQNSCGVDSEYSWFNSSFIKNNRIKNGVIRHQLKLIQYLKSELEEIKKIQYLKSNSMEIKNG